MARKAAPRQSRAMHPRTSPTSWPAPSQTERHSQAACRRLPRRALFFRLGARAALVGPLGLAKHGTRQEHCDQRVSHESDLADGEATPNITSVEQGVVFLVIAPREDVLDSPDDTAVITSEEQGVVLLVNAPREDVPDDTAVITSEEQETVLFADAPPDDTDVITSEEQEEVILGDAPDVVTSEEDVLDRPDEKDVTEAMDGAHDSVLQVALIQNSNSSNSTTCDCANTYIDGQAGLNVSIRVTTHCTASPRSRSVSGYTCDCCGT